MVANPRRQRLNLPLAPLAAGALATVVALLFALLPAGILENIVLQSGIAALVPAAEPPLGFTARAALIMIGGGGIGLVAWFALYLLVGSRTVTLGSKDPDSDGADMPMVRRADAHPDAPPRRPLFASRDLGTPFLDVRARSATTAAAPRPAEQALPLDLDEPLAAYDPQAIPAIPIDRPPSPAALRMPPPPPVFDDGAGFETFESFETFEAAPAVPAPAPAPAAAPPVVAVPRPASPPPPSAAPRQREADHPASIHALLDRLEKSVVRRDSPAVPAAVAVPAAAGTPESAGSGDGLRQSLDSLRRLATQVG